LSDRKTTWQSRHGTFNGSIPANNSRKYGKRRTAHDNWQWHSQIKFHGPSLRFNYLLGERRASRKTMPVLQSRKIGSDYVAEVGLELMGISTFYGHVDNDDEEHFKVNFTFSQPAYCNAFIPCAPCLVPRRCTRGWRYFLGYSQYLQRF
jgi:hypothetical protein